MKGPYHCPFVRGIHQWLVDSLHKGTVMWKMFPFDDIIINFFYFITISLRHMILYDPSDIQGILGPDAYLTSVNLQPSWSRWMVVASRYCPSMCGFPSERASNASSISMSSSYHVLWTKCYHGNACYHIQLCPITTQSIVTQYCIQYNCDKYRK